MSSVRVRNVQIGLDPTEANNITLYQPAFVDGTVRFARGNIETVSKTDLFILDSINQRVSAGNFVALTSFTAPSVTLGSQTNKATISYTVNTARTYTIPDVAASEFVMTAGDQAVGGVKTFSSTISGSISGNAGTVTNGVYTTGDQTIGGAKTFSSVVTVNNTIGVRASSSATAATQFPVFNADPASTTRTIVTRTPAQVLNDIGAAASSHSHTISWGAGTTAGPTLSVQGGSAVAIPIASDTAASGVVTTTTQTFGGAKTFSGNVRVFSFGVGTNASGVEGEIRATNNITAYFSDDRLKTRVAPIQDALDKVLKLNGFYYTENETAKLLGYKNDKVQVGVSAQEVEGVLPEIVVDAPINRNFSGADFKTVQYDKLVPLLIEAIKELNAKVETLSSRS